MNEQYEENPFVANEGQTIQEETAVKQKWWQRFFSELNDKSVPFYKKKLIWIAGAIIILVAVIAFSSNPVADDLINYINEDIDKIAETEEEMIFLYEQARKAPNDYKMSEIIEQQVIPKASELISVSESIEPKTEEVREVHELYIEVANKYKQAFTLMLPALQQQDYALVVEANEKIEEAKKINRDYIAAVKKLAEENNVVFKD